MKTIWKYPLIVDDFQVIKIPSGFKILNVQNQRGEICLWAMVEPSRNTEEITIWIVGTGHSIHANDGTWAYIGTVQQRNGELIWHVFMENK